MRRGLAVVALAAVLAAGCGTLTAANGPLPPPDAPWPTTGTYSVFLCSRDSAMAVCKGREISPEQRRAIQQGLVTTPGIKDVRFETREEAFKRLRESMKDTMLLKATRASDMPESFRGDYTVMKDEQVKALEAMPGVASVLLKGTDFWLGKADLAVRLCPVKPEAESSRCKGRGATTTAERDAVFEALSALEGVRTIYLESREHAAENDRRINANWPSNAEFLAEIMGESFHLVIERPEIVEQVKRAVEALPGVEKVVEHR